MSSNPQTVQKLLSIVIPVFNGGWCLEGCLASIHSALEKLDDVSRKRVEVLLFDNASSDNTLEVAEKFVGSCGLQISQAENHFENRTESWSRALSRATGTWMMMLHADDELSDSGLPKILSTCDKLLSDQRFVMVTGQHRTFEGSSPRSRLRPFWPFAANLSGKRLLNSVLPFFCPFVPFQIMRRASYEAIGGLDARYELVQDWNLWIRLLGRGDARYVPVEIGRWRTHAFSRKYAATIGREQILVASRLPELIPTLSKVSVREAIQAQVEKLVDLVPEVSVGELMTGVAAPDATWPVLSQEASKAGLKQLNSRIRKRLLVIRALGTLNRLFRSL